jgi:uncharacterized protein (TIGR02266 family)
MEQQSIYSDKRKYPRLAIQLPVRFRNLSESKDTFQKEITNTIGQGGLFIRTKTGFDKETKVQVELTLKDKVISARGIVRYLIPYDQETGGVQFPGMGVQFTVISPEDQEFISKYVEKELKKQVKTR